MTSVIDKWLDGRALEDIEVLERGGRSLYLDSIKRVDPKDPGKIIEQPVYVRVPHPLELAKSKAETLSMLEQSLGRKSLTIQSAKDIVGALVFEELDNMVLLSNCLFRKDDPATQYMMVSYLMDGHPRASLNELFERVSFYMELEDPRVKHLDEKVFWEVVDTIARKKNLGPLVAIAGPAQRSCIITMADQLLSYRKAAS